MTRRRLLMLAVAALCVGMIGCGERERLQAQLDKAEAEREVLRAQVQKVNEGIQTVQLTLTDTNARNEKLRTQLSDIKAEHEALKARLATALQEKDKWRKAADEAKLTIAKKDGEIKERDAALKEIRDFLTRNDRQREALRKELEKEKNTPWLDKLFKDLLPPPAPPPEP